MISVWWKPSKNIVGILTPKEFHYEYGTEFGDYAWTSSPRKTSISIGFTTPQQFFINPYFLKACGFEYLGDL